ncbi:MAG: hypothetical protein INR66_04015 [Gordonia polyisoprenivorans]|nr:hypothetical protein [Gordonia polyisoprenivorans]
MPPVRLRSDRCRTAAIVGALALVACLVPALQPTGSAHADVTLNCNGNDQRSAVDKLPRPGVIIVDHEDDGTYYLPATIDDDGTLDDVSLNPALDDATTPLVSVWQNGTACDGDEFTRNGWAVTPSGQVLGDDSQDGPAAGFYSDASGLPLNRPVVGMSPTATGNGYWLVASDGGIFTYGDAVFRGSTGNLRLNKPVVGMSVTPTGGGYWMVATDGGIFSFGDAPFYGSTGNLRLNQPITGMTTTPSGHGYWMVASDGGIFTFGDAPFYGSTGGRRLTAPIAGMVPNGAGYTLIGQDGQLYPFHP